MPRAGLSPAAVVDIALGIVDEDGPGALTLAAVAGRAGVAVPSLYKHIRNLGALHQKLAAAATAELAEVLTAATAGRAGGDAVEAIAGAYRSYARDRPGRYPTTQRVPDAADPAHVAGAERAVAAITAVLRGYSIAGDEAIHATRMLRSALHGFVSLEASGGFGMPQDVDGSFTRLVTALDLALRSWPGRAT
ncbi:TetR-like C-terminal domain-containing protein [Pseudonocardia nigra]|uniref:TetR-like C-terminal domain-containing protein n=1 Tax=Pseudonocardia nigra TaxID=1921578 RepID=UPI001C5FA42A|nr:TetR-like C-terminal domain-containing protein [Pseudonocardia nigra]